MREVAATICPQCGEEWIDAATARQLEQIVNDARARRLQVEVVAMFMQLLAAQQAGNEKLSDLKK